MAKNNSTKFMLNFVQEYLDGEKERMFFDLDFNHYFVKHYPKMEREDPDLAESFAFYLSEEGIDRTDGLSDAEHKKLIREQFEEFMAAMRDGFC